MDKRDIQTNPRLAGQVRRYHTWPVLRHQTNGEHTFQVLRLYLQIFGNPRVEVLSYIVKHDLGEIKVGDPPYPIKFDNPVLKAEMDRLETQALADMDVQLPELTPEEKVRFKFCDLLDCIEYARDEIQLGNQFMRPVFEQGTALQGYIEKMSPSDAIRAVRHCARGAINLDRDRLRKQGSGLDATYYDIRRHANDV